MVPRVISRLALALVLALSLIQCGDDATSSPDGASKIDSGSTKDGAAKVDQAMTADDGSPGKDGVIKADTTVSKVDAKVVKPDAGIKPSGLSCSAIGTCSDTCAAACSGLGKLTCMINCSNTCRGKGCKTAQTVYTALYNCINSKCLLSCAGGPNAGCKSCVTSKCSSQEKTCAAHKC